MGNEAKDALTQASVLTRHTVLRSVLLTAALAVAACSGSRSPATASSSASSNTMPALMVPAEDTSRVLRLRLSSKALAGNQLGDSATRTILAYLPRDYATSGKRYRTLYLLHGFGSRRSGNNAWIRSYRGFHLGHTMDSLAAAGVAEDMIVIAPDASTFYGGSFYSDSPVAGLYETYIVREIVGSIDATFRTIPKRESRGIAGHSMGGFGTLSLVTRHPDLFVAAYALSPCCIAPDDRPAESAALWKALAAVTTPEEVIKAGFMPQATTSLGIAFSPNVDRKPLMFDAPVTIEGATVTVNPAVLAKWRARSPLFLMDSLSEGLKTLRGLAFDAGRSDNFRDIPLLVPVLDSMLTAKGVAHTSELYDGDHSNRVGERMKTKVLPFFDRLLAK